KHSMGCAHCAKAHFPRNDVANLTAVQFQYQSSARSESSSGAFNRALRGFNSNAAASRIRGKLLPSLDYRVGMIDGGRVPTLDPLEHGPREILRLNSPAGLEQERRCAVAEIVGKGGLRDIHSYSHHRELKLVILDGGLNQNAADLTARHQYVVRPLDVRRYLEVQPQCLSYANCRCERHHRS